MKISAYLFRGMLLVTCLMVGITTWASDRWNELDQLYALAKAGHHDQALAQTDDLIRRFPGEAPLLFVKGLILDSSGRTEAAIELFEEIARNHPRLPEPHNNLAVLYTRQGRLDDAVNALKKAIHAHPSYAMAHENLGDLYATMASKAYEKALSLDESNPQALTKLMLIEELFTVPGDQGASPVWISEAQGSDGSTNQVAEWSTTAEGGGSPAREAELKVVLSQWAEAWSARDPQRYLSFYADKFRPRKGLSRQAWSRQRQQRLAQAKFIEVKVSDIHLTWIGDGARVYFTQDYRSDNYADSITKRMTLVQRDGQWMILREESGG